MAYSVITKPKIVTLLPDSCNYTMNEFKAVQSLQKLGHFGIICFIGMNIHSVSPLRINLIYLVIPSKVNSESS